MTSATAAAGAGLALILLLRTAPEPPSTGDGWRWATVVGGLVLCAWNLRTGLRAFRRRGLLSVLAFLHLWCLVSLSYPAVEWTYRYASLRTFYWSIETDTPLTLSALAVIAAFQLVFFTTLGNRFDERLAPRLRASRATRPNVALAAILALLLLPLIGARLVLIRNLGLAGALETAVRRDDYAERLDVAVSPALWLLNALFPIFAVTLCCLIVKYAVPHPSLLGAALYAGTLVGCGGAVALSGGRGELVYVALTVVVFTNVSGYRSLPQFAPILVPLGLAGALLFLVAQARTGGENRLSETAGDPYGNWGGIYSVGDVSQIHGLGRFDAVLMILDRHVPAENLGGSSYGYAVNAALNNTLLPRLTLGEHLPVERISDSVLGYWVFHEPIASVLPSSPGEGYLNFGVPGVLVGAAVLGLAVRAVLAGLSRLPGPLEFAWVLSVWIIARLVSDETYNTLSFAARNLLVAAGLTLLLVCLGRSAPRGPAPPPPCVSRPALRTQTTTTR